MQYQKIRDHEWAIRISRGEQIIVSLESFCHKNSIAGGAFYGIGACDDVTLAHYSVADRKYSKKNFTEALEITNITGTVGVLEDRTLIVHAHITCSRADMNTIAGHLVEGRISGTLELYFTETEKLLKKKDVETGLNLFELVNE